MTPEFAQALRNWQTLTKRESLGLLACSRQLAILKYGRVKVDAAEQSLVDASRVRAGMTMEFVTGTMLASDHPYGELLSWASMAKAPSGSADPTRGK